MAMSAHLLLVYSNGQKIKSTKDMEALWKSIGVSADGNDNGMTISESAGKFDFNGKVLGNIAAGTAAGQALSFSQVGANNGVAGLDSGGKVPVAQLPNSIMEYKGTYDPTGGSGAGVPALADGTGNSGDTYKVTVAGSHDFGGGALSMVVGDYVIYNGATWEVAHSGADAVISVNSQSGVVSLDTDDISEGTTNLYYTSSRFDADFGGKTTDNLTEGVTNFYYTSTRFDNDFGGKTTDDLPEGAVNKYAGSSDYASFTNKELSAISVRNFVKMTVAGEVTLLAAADSALNDDTFIGCVKDTTIAADAAGNVYLPEVGARVTGFTGLDVTKQLWATTAGGYTQTRPTTGKVVLLGRPISATEIIFIGKFVAEYV